MPNMEIAIIGPADVAKPFRVLGVHCYETQEPEAALKIIQTIEQEKKVAMVFIAESIAANIMERIEQLKLKELPAVFILPEYGSEQRLGLKRLEETMARAIGKKI